MTMQTIRFGKKEDSNVIDIEDVEEREFAIYCYVDGKILYFLDHRKTIGTRYTWLDLSLGLNSSCGGLPGYSSFKEALKEANSTNRKVLIFDSQCEVLEYAKKL